MSTFPVLTDEVSERTRAILEWRRSLARPRRRGWLVRRSLLLADVAGLVLAFTLAQRLVPARGFDRVGAIDESLIFMLTLPLWIVAAQLYGLYGRDEERTDHTTGEDLVDVFHLLTVGVWILYGVTSLTGLAHPTLAKMFTFWIIGITFVVMFRVLARTYCRRQIAYLQNTVIVGAGDVGQLIARKLLLHSEFGLNLVGFVDANPRALSSDLESIAVLGGTHELPSLIKLLDIERVIIAFSSHDHREILGLIRELTPLNVQIDIVPALFESVTPNVRVHMVEGLPLLGLPALRLSRSSRRVKRLIDVVLASIIGILAAPLLAAISVVVMLDSPGPILYRHRRIGRNGKPIDVLKFRTMKLEACRGDRYGGAEAERLLEDLLGDPGRQKEFVESYKLKEDPRVTRVGVFLRRSSLDELPQLINVLRGDMSLVGPRAITEEELPRYSDAVDSLLSVRPGVTGYWQVNGRSRLSYEDRVRLDLAYIGGWSLGLDANILVKTLRTLVRPGAC